MLKQHHITSTFADSLYLSGHRRAPVKIFDQMTTVVVYPLIDAINYILKSRLTKSVTPLRLERIEVKKVQRKCRVKNKFGGGSSVCPRVCFVS